MSGGTFDYQQSAFDRIADEIEERINRNGKLKPKEDLWLSKDFYESYPEERYYEKYSEETIRELQKMVSTIRTCKESVDTADKLFALDHSEQTFLNKINDERSFN